MRLCARASKLNRRPRKSGTSDLHLLEQKKRFFLISLTFEIMIAETPRPSLLKERIFVLPGSELAVKTKESLRAEARSPAPFSKNIRCLRSAGQPVMLV